MLPIRARAKKTWPLNAVSWTRPWPMLPKRPGQLADLTAKAELDYAAFHRLHWSSQSKASLVQTFTLPGRMSFVFLFFLFFLIEFGQVRDVSYRSCYSAAYEEEKFLLTCECSLPVRDFFVQLSDDIVRDVMRSQRGPFRWEKRWTSYKLPWKRPWRRTSQSFNHSFHIDPISFHPSTSTCKDSPLGLSAFRFSGLQWLSG